MNHFYKITSALLDYPTATLIQDLAEINDALQSIPAKPRAWLAHFLHEFEQKPLATLQEAYVSTFDRGAVPLYLFHYVHGESKDRGTAMVDLKAQYTQAGFIFAAPNHADPAETCTQELPDALPVYVEYLSLLPPSQRQQALAEVVHLLSAIAAALHQLGSVYYYLLAGLVSEVDGELPSEAFVLREDAPELSEKTLQEIDATWQEEPAFANVGVGENCGTTHPCADVKEHIVQFS